MRQRAESPLNRDYEIQTDFGPVKFIHRATAEFYSTLRMA
jgi:hypothetical protein